MTTTAMALRVQHENKTECSQEQKSAGLSYPECSVGDTGNCV